MDTILNYIAGKFVPSSSDHFIPNINPARGEAYSRIPDSNADDVNLAVEAASMALPIWSKMPLEERAGYLDKIADGIEARLEEFCRAECVDTGKPLQLTEQVDIPRSIQNFRFFASAIRQFSSESHLDASSLNYTRRDPVGVVGLISPWNLPLYLLSWKIAPALAAGNTVVAKPSEVTPMTAFMLCKVMEEIGLPQGVFNLVHGSGPSTGEALVGHPRVKAISFTGGTSTGKRIASVAAPQLKKLSLELGGKNAGVIFADADYDKALARTVRSAFTNQGQICLCTSRLLIEESLYPKFRDDFVSRVRTLKVGDPLNRQTDQGAVVSEAHFNKVLSYIELAKSEGGKILTGGKPAKAESGWFIEPTVIEGLPMESRANQEEIFGPVVTLMPFKSEIEALRLANSSIYGLASVVWTSDLNKAHRMAERLEAGIIWINTWMKRDLRTPFGGMKASGMGREGGLEALRFFTEPKNVCIEF
jgi:aminomuconate-semialdehyde/2-hydroxymuconate-6-semialdehyde dehydrogenase